MTNAYKMPADQSWVPLMVVDAGAEDRDIETYTGSDPEVLRMRKPANEDDVVTTTVPHFTVKLAHVEQKYGDRVPPYELSVPVQDILVVRTKTRRVYNKQDGSLILSACGIPDGAPVEQARQMLAKKVMGYIHHSTKSFPDGDGGFIEKTFDKVSWVAPLDGVRIPVRTDGGMQDLRIAWRDVSETWARNFPELGQKLNVIALNGSRFTVIRVRDEWHDLNN